MTTGYDERVRRKMLNTDGWQDLMERFWSNSIFKYLRVEPEDHHFLLTEPVGVDLPTPRIQVLMLA